MVENLLTEAIRDYLSQSLKDFRLPSQTGETLAPSVYNAYLPPTGQTTAPFVIVRAEGGTTSQLSTVINVSIIVSTYSKEVDGHEHCLALMAHIRNSLTSLPTLTLNDRYQLRFPLNWKTYPEQPYPIWQIDMETTWVIESAHPTLEEF